MQTGLWGMQVDYVRAIEAGESTSYELERDYIESVLPLMSAAMEYGSGRSVGGRCSTMSQIREHLINSFFRPGPKFSRIDVPTIMADANCPLATEFSQRTLTRLLAMQLIGAGYNVKSVAHFDSQDPQSRPLIGTPEGFQGYTGMKVVLNGVDTRVKKVGKITEFMQTARALAQHYLQDHIAAQGTETQLGASDQLAHRARLVLLAADPGCLQSNPDLVKPLVHSLNRFEKVRIRQYYERDPACPAIPADLSDEVLGALRVAKPVILPS